MPAADLPDVTGANWRLYFGGPDKAAGRLRDVLAAKVEASVAGESLDWVTYYFCDMDLAERLMAASDRGVQVNIVIEAQPRYPSANQAVIARFKAHPIWKGVRLNAPRTRLGGHLHAKIYAFHGASPCVFMGSFNPSADGAGNPDLLRDIGDQDRGHNLLLELTGQDDIAALQHYVADLMRWNGRLSRRLRSRRIQVQMGEIYTFPRIFPKSAMKTGFWPRADMAKGSDVFLAASHLKGSLIPGFVSKALRQGGRVRILTHHTERRAPEDTLHKLRQQGADIRRYEDENGLPMHGKFAGVRTTDGRKISRLGSLNYNPKSRWLNDEILLQSEDALLYEALRGRFNNIWSHLKSPA